MSRRDEGSILPLVAGYLALALALIVVVIAASSLYLTRARLYAVADGAALAAAESFPLEAVAVDGSGVVRAQLEEGLVDEAAARYLASAPTRLEELTLLESGTPDGRSAVVRLAATWRPPLVSALLPAGVRLEVESTARTAFR